jgi:hypothetical protein
MAFPFTPREEGFRGGSLEDISQRNSIKIIRDCQLDRFLKTQPLDLPSFRRRSNREAPLVYTLELNWKERGIKRVVAVD